MHSSFIGNAPSILSGAMQGTTATKPVEDPLFIYAHKTLEEVEHLFYQVDNLYNRLYGPGAALAPVNPSEKVQGSFTELTERLAYARNQLGQTSTKLVEIERRLLG